MGHSVFMMVECKPHDEEGEADEQEADTFSLHNTAIYRDGKKNSMGYALHSLAKHTVFLDPTACPV